MEMKACGYTWVPAWARRLQCCSRVPFVLWFALIMMSGPFEHRV